MLTLAAWLIPIGTMLDGLENLTSFVMLAQALNFPDWIAMIYSSFAVLKFGAIGVGFCCVFLGILAGVVAWMLKRLKFRSLYRVLWFIKFPMDSML